MSTQAQLQVILAAAKSDAERATIWMRFTSTQQAILRYGDAAGPNAGGRDEMKPIKVPDVPAPRGKCWKQNLLMERCTFKPLHKGRHQWDTKEYRAYLKKHGLA